MTELIVQKSRTGNRGFSLLELLIALIVFSIGLLAIAGLQTVSKQANFEALQRTTAAQVANGLLEDMRTNGNGIDVYAAAAQIGGGSIAAEPGPTCRDADECNAAEKAAHDLWFWEQILDGNLETNAGIAAGGDYCLARNRFDHEQRRQCLRYRERELRCTERVSPDRTNSDLHRPQFLSDT